MSQKLSDWASIAEIASSVAVVVTLIALVVELRGNTEEIRVAALTNLADRNQSLILTLASVPEISEALAREVQGEELSFAEELRLTALFGANVRMAEESFIAYESGRLAEDIVRTRTQNVVDTIAGSDHFLRRWEVRRDSGWYIEPFVIWFDNRIKEASDR